MTNHPEYGTMPENSRSLSSQEQEEIVVHALENHLRRLALGRNNPLPRWAIW